jgi:hypothetical protein
MTNSTAEVVREILVEDQCPIIAARDLEDLLRKVYAGVYSDRYKVRTRKEAPSETDLYRAVQRLESARVVRQDPDFGSTHYQVFDVLEQSAEAVCCTVDPFVYISHLSAMQLQGLTDRNPTALVLTRPADILWQQMRSEAKQNAPLLPDISPSRSRPKYRFSEHVRGRPILLHETRHPGAWESMGPRVRVATLGQVFLDMVVRPGWCGGISHVLEVWEREAETHLNEIIATVNVYPAKLPKVRAGYILNDMLGITDERVLAWRAFAQRGSSQKLDPEKPYAPIYSENWMISLNA